MTARTLHERACIFDRIESFASNYQTPAADLALLSFIRGECTHYARDEDGACELCGDEDE